MTEEEEGAVDNILLPLWTFLHDKK
jgi:hypothetical protein